jgi:hypothetical protein
MGTPRNISPGLVFQFMRYSIVVATRKHKKRGRRGFLIIKAGTVRPTSLGAVPDRLAAIYGIELDQPDLRQ